MTASPLEFRAAGPRLAEIALEAAALIRPYWRAGGAVSMKADSSPVTEADQRAETLILDRLRRDFPGVPVVAEELSEAFGRPDAAADLFFLVDPLDGTRGFVRGSDEFTVNIALIASGAPVSGAVATPADDRVWFTAGGGARLREASGERFVRTRAWPAEPLALVSGSMSDDARRRMAERYGFAACRAVNSSLKFCLIAQGEADIYPRENPTSEWDTAAGQAVLEAAGGSVTTLDGARLTYGRAGEGFLNPPFVARGQGSRSTSSQPERDE